MGVSPSPHTLWITEVLEISLIPQGCVRSRGKRFLHVKWGRNESLSEQPQLLMAGQQHRWGHLRCAGARPSPKPLRFGAGAAELISFVTGRCAQLGFQNRKEKAPTGRKTPSPSSRGALRSASRGNGVQHPHPAQGQC